jgi:hypothetical protein
VLDVEACGSYAGVEFTGLVRVPVTQEAAGSGPVAPASTTSLRESWSKWVSPSAISSQAISTGPWRPEGYPKFGIASVMQTFEMP